MKDSQYLIIGAGLSGIILSWQFYFNNIDFIIIDEELETTSSKVAAGIYNPIVFKRLTPSWRASELISYLTTFYDKIENILNTKFHQKKNILRIFTDQNDIKLWFEKLKNEEFTQFLSNEIEQSYSDQLNIGLGYSKIINSGVINTKLFLEKSKSFFKAQNFFYNEIFDFSELEVSSSKYKNHSYSKIIFAEGHKAIKNPFFDWIPFNLAKGELLKVKIQDYTIDDIPNKRIFILNHTNEYQIVGATYQWNFEDDKPTENEKHFLINHLTKLIKNDFEILEHFAGIRPAIIDRRPAVGVHPNYKDIYIFNGMGSKAVILAPYISSLFFQNLTKNEKLDEDISIDRFLKKHYNN